MTIGLEGQNLIFLISQPRAGSTLLQRILGCHPDIYTLSEPGLMVNPLRVITQRFKCENAYDKELRDRWRIFLHSIPDGLEKYIENVRHMHVNLYNHALENTGKCYFLDKCPLYYAYMIPELFRTFPAACYILLFRNPIAVLCSVVKTWTGYDRRLLIEHYHRPGLVDVPFFMIEGVNILGAKCVVVHYERLLTNPEEEIRKILQKIGLDFYPEMIEYGKHDLPRWPAGDQNSVYRYTKPNSQNLEDWKLELKHPIMWKLANTYLEILGETTIERMGYSYQEIRTILTECKPSLLWMVSMTSISQSVLTRLHRFLHQSWQERVQSVRFRLKRVWNRIVPFAPLPVRLPFGSWWLAWNDVCSDAIFTGGFEEAEWHFVERFLQPGMTVLDIGAHHGFYTLLASQKVGPDGKVVAFEPSPRERKRLLWHLRLNRCRNVQVETFALGSREGEAELFLVVGKDTGCNSLRLPNVTEPIRLVRVPVVQLDDYLRQNFIEHVDFIKMDVEGAELEVLKGATELLQRKPLPVWLVEVEDVRTQPWGYKAVEIIKFLRQFGYHWFKPLADGSLIPIRPTQEQYDGNLVAVPEERLEQLQGLVKEVSHDEVSPSVH